MRSRDLELADRLRDERSRQVAFVSHCLLNENTRYLGGAFRSGPVAELVTDLADRDVGICQMPCPEQSAWGGVLKRRMLLAYGSSGDWRYRLRSPLLGLFLLDTARVYRRLARQVAEQIADYQRSGCTVVAIIGVGSSPSCGVRTTLDIRRSFAAMADMPADAVERPGQPRGRPGLPASRHGTVHPGDPASAAPPRPGGPAAGARPGRRDAGPSSARPRRPSHRTGMRSRTTGPSAVSGARVTFGRDHLLALMLDRQHLSAASPSAA